jgi:APA family basic amino acid/polyamine antiporter
MCLGMVAPVALDITAQARRGDILPACVLGGYALVGVAIYVFYGLRRSRPVARNPVTIEQNA